MENLKIKLGKRIKSLRKSKNITQEKLAEIISMDVTSLSKIETGRNYPLPETLEKLAFAFDVDIDRLFYFKKIISEEDYLSEIYKNIDLIKNNNEKLKIMYEITKVISQ